MSARARAPRQPDPLAPGQRAAVVAAGGIGLALVAGGAGVVWGLLVGALVLAILRAAVIDLFDDVDWGRRGVVAWIEQLDAGWLVPLVLALVLAAVGAMALGCWSSTRRMRRAGVPDAAAVTLRGAAVGTALQGVLSTLSSWLLGLLALLSGGLGLWPVAAIWLVASIALSSAIGWLAGPRVWLAMARGAARRAAATPQGSSPHRGEQPGAHTVERREDGGGTAWR